MHELKDYAPVLASGLSVIYVLFFYPLALFRYRITESAIEMEWIVFGFIRVSRRKFDLAHIESATVTNFLRCLWAGKGFHVFGNIFARRGVVFVLKKGVLWTSFGKTIYITPRDPEAFISRVRSIRESGGSV